MSQNNTKMHCMCICNEALLNDINYWPSEREFIYVNFSREMEKEETIFAFYWKSTQVYIQPTKNVWDSGRCAADSFFRYARGEIYSYFSRYISTCKRVFWCSCMRYTRTRKKRERENLQHSTYSCTSSRFT